MSTIRVDDEDSNVFTNGDWFVSHGVAMAYQGGVSISSADGSTKIARFRGTSINVIGFVLRTNSTAPLPADQHQVVQFMIDGGSRTWAPNPNPNDYDRVAYQEYYKSGQLPFGEHVLTMINMGTDGNFVLDEFVIKANGGTAQILKSDGSQTPSKNGPDPSPVTSPSKAPSVSPTTQSPSSSSATSSQPSSSSASSRSNSNSQSASSSDSTGNPLSTSASSVFSASIYYPTTINANDLTNENDGKGSHKTRVVIAIVVPCLVVALIMFGIIVLLKRKRRKANSVPTNPYPPSTSGALMTQVSPPAKVSPRILDAITMIATMPAYYVTRYEKQRTRTRALDDAGLPPYAP